jgi:hypothetical protein
MAKEMSEELDFKIKQLAIGWIDRAQADMRDWLENKNNNTVHNLLRNSLRDGIVKQIKEEVLNA